MFWLFDENIKESYEFFQIFNKINKTVIDNNEVCILDSVYDVNKIKNLTPIKCNFNIRVCGQLISYTDLDTKKTITFSKRDEISEKNSLTFFHNIYKLVDNHRLPHLKKDFYDYYYEHIELNIYVINKNCMFIHEINKSNGNERNYCVSTGISGFNFF
jgi:hypothetical protein